MIPLVVRNDHIYHLVLEEDVSSFAVRCVFISKSEKFSRPSWLPTKEIDYDK